jgi:hypothetical protein
MRTQLIAFAAILSIATLAAAPLASASVSGGGGSTSSGGGGGGGGGHGGGGGGGGGHGGGGGGGHFGGGHFGGGGFYMGGAFRAAGAAAGYAGHGTSIAHGFYAAHLGYGLIGFRSAGLGDASAVHVGAAPNEHGAMRLAIGPRFRSAATARPVVDHGHHYPGHHPHKHHPFSKVSCNGADCEAETYLQPLSCPLPWTNASVKVGDNDRLLGCASALKVKAEK